MCIITISLSRQAPDKHLEKFRNKRGALSAGHPGRLVKEWQGAELNMTAPAGDTGGGYVWGVPCNSSDRTQRGWSYDDKQHAIKTPSGRCVTHNASAAATFLTAEECRSENPNQARQENASFCAAIL